MAHSLFMFCVGRLAMLLLGHGFGDAPLFFSASEWGRPGGVTRGKGMAMSRSGMEFKHLTGMQQRLVEFMKAETLDDALAVAWQRDGASEDYYAHYTSLPALVAIISSRKWRLTQSTSASMNDRQEIKKFGSEKIAGRTYQASFARGVRESAAQWGLYGRESPFAIKVLIAKAAMVAWVEELKGKGLSAEFKSVVYASVPRSGKHDSHEKKRGCSLAWQGVNCNLNPEERKALPGNLKREDFTGWFKDIEWAHEDEVRLCVRLPKSARKYFSVEIPTAVFEQMSFTLSPWLDQSSEKEIMKTIQTFLAVHNVKFKLGKIRRSTLAGALNFGMRCSENIRP